MEKSGHVMMAGEGAEAFGKKNGADFVEQKYFYTKERWDALEKVKAAEKSGGSGGKKFIISDQDRHGTVGAVALDKKGNLAAATSTVGHDISALMEYRGMSLKEAAQAVLDKVAKLGGTGGLIAIDRQGNIVLPFNTSGMYRGYVDPNGKFVVEIYK